MNNNIGFQASLATNNVLAYLIEGCKMSLPTPDVEKRLHGEVREMNFRPNLEPNCLCCGKPDVPKRCANCHSVFFCNEECAKKAWSDHKKQCGRNLFTVCLSCGRPDYVLLRSMMQVDKDSKTETLASDFLLCERCPVRYCSKTCKERLEK